MNLINFDPNWKSVGSFSNFQNATENHFTSTVALGK